MGKKKKQYKEYIPEEHDMGIAEEPRVTYQQPLSFEKVWAMFKETREQMQETDRLLSEKFAESDRKLKELAKMYGGMSKSNADIAESHFFNGLASKMNLGNVQFDEIFKNLYKRTKHVEGEFDIVLTNQDTVVVIEVKYKLQPNYVTDFIENKLPNFRKLFPEYNNHKLFAGMASFTIPDESKTLALEHGLFLLLPSGDNIKLVNKKGFVPKEY